MSAQDELYIRRAIDLSRAAVEHGNHPFGALLVKDAAVVLEAENTIFTENNITDHAETRLIRLAAAQFAPAFLGACTLYTSTEPCPMCCGAIYWSGVARVVYACSNATFKRVIGGDGFNLSSRDLFASGDHHVEVIGPVLEDEAMQVHRSYWK